MVAKGGETVLPIADAFFSLPPASMTALGTGLGFALVGHLNADQQNSLGNFLMLIGQILTTHAGQQQLLSDERSGQTLASVQQQIACLQARLDALSPQAETCP